MVRLGGGGCRGRAGASPYPAGTVPGTLNRRTSTYLAEDQEEEEDVQPEERRGGEGAFREAPRVAALLAHLGVLVLEVRVLAQRAQRALVPFVAVCAEVSPTKACLRPRGRGIFTLTDSADLELRTWGGVGVFTL